jgi:site-specific recombinase XerD
MLRSGLRIGEVCQLKQVDINFGDQQLMIHNGKGKVDRMVYFSLEVQNSLLSWLNQRGYESIYCFASQRSTKVPLHATIIRTWMKNYLQEQGLSEKGYTPHSLRHTFATNLLNADIPLVVLKDLMGHRSMDQTLMYAKLSDQTIRQSYQKACEKLEPSESDFIKKEALHG